MYDVNRVSFVAYADDFLIVTSSSEMLKPHWLKSSHVTGTVNAYYLFYTHGCNMNMNRS